MSEGSVPLHLLDLPVSKLAESLAGLDYDQLSVLYDAEENGKTRKSALAAIDAARELVSVDALAPSVEAAPETPPTSTEEGSAPVWDMTSPAARYAHSVSYAQALSALGPDHPMVLTHPARLEALEAASAPQRIATAEAATVRSAPPEPAPIGTKSQEAPAPTPKPVVIVSEGARSAPPVEMTGPVRRSIPVPTTATATSKSAPAPEHKTAPHLIRAHEQLIEAARLAGLAGAELPDPVLRGKVAEARGILRTIAAQL